MPINLYDRSTSKLITVPDAETAKELIFSNKATFGSDQDVPMVGGDGELYTVKGKDAVGYMMDKGFTPASSEEITKKAEEETYSTLPQKAITAGEGAVNMATLGFGNYLTKKGIQLLDEEVADRYKNALEKRKEYNPESSLAGDFVGVIADPINIFGGLSKVGGAVAEGVGLTGKALTKLKAPQMLGRALESSAIKTGAKWAVEGGVISATTEAGKELLDTDAINSDAILSKAKEGALVGGVIGGAGGLAKDVIGSGYRATMGQAKKYLDDIVKPSEELKGELIKESPTYSLKRKQDPMIPEKDVLVLTESNSGWEYNDGQKVGVFSEIKPSANSLDLSSPEAIQKFGESNGINDLGQRLKYKTNDQSLAEFLGQERAMKYVKQRLVGVAPSLDNSSRVYYENALANEKNLLDKLVPDSGDYDAYKIINSTYKNIYSSLQETGALEASEAIDAITKTNTKNYSKILNNLDYIKDISEDGKYVYKILNPEVLPEKITTTFSGKPQVTLTKEAELMAKQLGISPQKQVRLGNKRLNEISDFILDHYPKTGNFITKARTSMEYIANAINDTELKAISELDETIQSALNLSGRKKFMTTNDIADFIEGNIASKYTDKINGKPLSGLEKEYNQVKEFADNFRNNYVVDRYGKKEFVKLDVEQIRDIRINQLDKVAKFAKEGKATALENAARETRTWLEDEVMSRVGHQDHGLLQRYIKAKKDYQNVTDSKKIIELAAKKAATKSGLSFDIASTVVGYATGGFKGAVIGKVASGMAKDYFSGFEGTLQIFMARNFAKDVSRFENLIKSSAKGFLSPVPTVAKVYIKEQTENGYETAKKDFAKYSNELRDQQAYLDNFVESNRDFFASYPKTAGTILNKTINARKFLIDKFPKNPFEGNPVKEKQWVPSKLEIEKYERYREAISNPSLILEQIKHGYVTPESIEVLSTIYPETKQKLAEELMANIDKISGLNVQRRQMMYNVFGIKLDQYNDPKTFLEIQQDSNAQAFQSANEKMNPNNAFKIKSKSLTLGNKTAEPRKP